MTRQHLELGDADLIVLATALDTDAETLQAELNQRPWYLNDVLRSEETADAVLGGTVLAVSPLLFFGVMAHRSAAELAEATWVGDWTGPHERLPVFDVEPLLEFTDDPGRLAFVASLLSRFVFPDPAPVPVNRLDLTGLADWLEAVDPDERVSLLRRLGDLALFEAGVFPDRNGTRVPSERDAERLGRSIGLSGAEVLDLIDPASSSPGLDTLEAFGAAWYEAAADVTGPSTPPLLLDVARRFRAARRFLNHIADQYLHDATPTLAPGY